MAVFQHIDVVAHGSETISYTVAGVCLHNMAKMSVI